MRALLALALLMPVLAACGTPIPAKDEFGATALLAAGDIAPGYAEFNRFDAAMNDLVADQICAGPHRPLEEKVMPAVPGRFEQLISRCRTHVPLFGS